MGATGDRRPLRSRQTSWAAAVLAMLLRTPLTANQISALGILFSIAGAGAILAAPQYPSAWLLAALAIQLRLLANLMDGLVAVEGGRGSPSGAIWNEAPDRLEDTLFLVAFGYALGMPWLGWLAAVLAVGTAYVRVLGGTFGLPQDFGGPMAKPHRMAALTVGCVLAALESWWLGSLYAPAMVLLVVALGSAATVARRLVRQGRELASRAVGPGSPSGP